MGFDPARSQGSYRRGAVLAVAALALVVMGARLALEIDRLLFVPQGPVDLLIYHGVMRDWFAGNPIYEGLRGAVHPPGTYLILWPLIGWGPMRIARWVYAVQTAVVIALFARLLLREARPGSGSDRGLIAVLVVACYPAAITIGNGQITFHVLLATLAAVLIQLREAPGARRDAALTALFLFALVKPHLTLPFFWVIAFSRGWLRPAILAIVAYLAATAVSIALHGTGLEGVRALLEAWFVKGRAGAVMAGYGNLHIWLEQLGLRSWIFPASGLAFALHGLWSWRHRTADLWIRIGVAAIVARVWAYHRVYDDLLLVLPLIALYREANREAADPTARGLFLLGAVVLAAPITPILERASWGVVAVWLLQLVYLVRRARQTRESAPEVSAA